MAVSAVAFGVIWGCLFFPLSLQPRWIRTAADANPAAYVITAGQRLMNAGHAGAGGLHMLAALASTAAVLVPLTIRAFRTPAGQAKSA